MRHLPALLVLLALAWPTVPAVAIEPETVARILREEFGVEVLRIREIEVDRRRILVVTVMFPAGDRNNAFQVGELWLDADTGEPVPRLVHRPDGYELPPPRVRGIREPTADMLREWTFEGLPPG